MFKQIDEDIAKSRAKKNIVAKIVFVTPLDDIPPIDEKYLSESLKGQIVIKGKQVGISYFAGKLRFTITKIIPLGPALIVKNTIFKIKNNPLRKKSSKLWAVDNILNDMARLTTNAYQFKDYETAVHMLRQMNMFLVGCYIKEKTLPDPEAIEKPPKLYYKKYYEKYSPRVFKALGRYLRDVLESIKEENEENKK